MGGKSRKRPTVSKKLVERLKKGMDLTRAKKKEKQKKPGFFRLEEK